MGEKGRGSMGYAAPGEGLQFQGDLAPGYFGTVAYANSGCLAMRHPIKEPRMPEPEPQVGSRLEIDNQAYAYFFVPSVYKHLVCSPVSTIVRIVYDEL